MRSVQELLDADPATKDRLFERNALLAAMSPYYEKNYEKGDLKRVEPGNKPQSEGGFDRVVFCSTLVAAANGKPQAYPAPTPTCTPTPKK
jgi:hypothetical protein